MGFFQTVKQWSQQNTERYVYTRIPAERTDADISDRPLVPDSSYFRVWLSEMYLANSREWFTEWYPAVQASVNLRFGGESPNTYSRIVRAPNDALAKGVLINYPLTELLPYRGGIVEIEAALMAFQGRERDRLHQCGAGTAGELRRVGVGSVGAGGGRGAGSE